MVNGLFQCYCAFHLGRNHSQPNLINIELHLTILVEIESSDVVAILLLLFCCCCYSLSIFGFLCCVGGIPVIPLNYSVLSNETAFSRDTVELCIKEILLAMSHCLFSQKNIQLDFCKIGRLFIREKKAKMKFYLNFIRQLHSSAELEQLFRPLTDQSEMSIMSSSTVPGTRLSTALPK